MAENENTNKLFIIGNGFDLAHGLKTKYEDFLLWYLQKVSNREVVNDGIIENLSKLNWTLESITDFLNKIKYFKNTYSTSKIKYIH